MISLTVREIIFDLRNMFRGWNIVILILFLGLSVLMAKTEDESTMPSVIVFFGIWTALTMKPKINKLYYILPTKEKDRVTYLLLKSFGIFLFDLIFYLLSITLVVILTEHQFVQEMKAMFYRVIPFLIAYVAAGMGSGYNWNRQKNGETDKKNTNQYVLSMLMMFFPLLYVTMFDLFSTLFVGKIYMITSVIAYLCAFLCLHFQLSLCRHTDLSVENIKIVEKIF